MSLVHLYQNPKRDGGPLGWLSCASTATAMLIAFETAGAKHPSGGDVRACTRNADSTPDVRGGTKPSQNVDAALRCWGVTLDYRVLDFEEAWRLSDREDVALSISISYVPISGTEFDGSPGFRGLHQIVRHAGLVYDPLADGRRPGISRGPQPWPKALLRDAVGRYAGEGKAACVVGIAPIAKPKRYSVLFERGAIWVYFRGGRHPDAFRRQTSAPCTAPFLIPWRSGKKRVVEITGGRLKGQRVEPGTTHVRLREWS